MHFLYPFALLGLLAVPTLVAIYWLRNRSRVVPVSSLMLWLDQSEIQHGGIRLRRLQTPLLFYIELIALVLLTLAAAGPQIRTAQSSQSLVVILDDSYSMLAGGDDSPRKRGFAALRDEFATGNWYSARCLIAGQSPSLLDSQSLSELLGVIDQKWTCRAAHADLDSALNLAAELGGKHAALLVISDRKPAVELPEGRMQWWAFGEPRDNLAFVNAARSVQPGFERLLLEIANFSAKPQSTTLVISDESGKSQLQRSTLNLEPRETRRLTLRLEEKSNAEIVHASVRDNILPVDNQVTLAPPTEQPVRVQVNVQDDKLRPLVDRVLEASKRATLTANAPELVITDSAAPETTKTARPWVLRFVSEKEAEAYLGPFVMDRSHPLNEGLSLNGVIWGAGKSPKVSGTPVISVGNTPLVTDLETPTGEHDIQVRLRHDLSTLAESPQWAVFMWNLLQWRASQLDGLVRSNVRLGESAILKTTERETVIAYPDGSKQKKKSTGRQLAVPTDQVGLYRIAVGKREFPFGCNALYPDESDLKDASTGKWGEWSRQAAPTTGVESFSWLLVLIVAAVLTVHLWLARRSGF